VQYSTINCFGTSSSHRRCGWVFSLHPLVLVSHRPSERYLCNPLSSSCSTSWVDDSWWLHMSQSAVTADGMGTRTARAAHRCKMHGQRMPVLDEEGKPPCRRPGQPAASQPYSARFPQTLWKQGAPLPPGCPGARTLQNKQGSGHSHASCAHTLRRMSVRPIPRVMLRLHAPGSVISWSIVKKTLAMAEFP
jgi:hypothetical protein